MAITYEELLQEASDEGVHVVEKHFKSNAKGLCKGNKIAVNKKILTKQEKKCILAEEMGHYYTTVGDILPQDNIAHLKQEYTARKWAYGKLIPIEDILNAISSGHGETFSMAEFLDVDENFLQDCLKYYGFL